MNCETTTRQNPSWSRTREHDILVIEIISSEYIRVRILTLLYLREASRIPIRQWVTFSQPQVRTEEGSFTQLPCVAQGNPPPTY
ncbi:hypothetical protein NPIL_460371, partial [Nephila pilipes]